MWKDKIKSYNYPEIKESILIVGKFKLAVHKNINHPPDVWVTSCHGLFWCHQLESKDIDNAKIEAIEKTQNILEEALKVLNENLNVIKNG